MLHLKRELGLFDVIVYAIGGIVGAGIYVLVGKAAGITGNSVWLSFIFAAIVAALTGLTYAELSSCYPVDSAEYRYSRIAFKDRRFSFAIGWIKVFTMIIAASAVSVGFGGYFSKLTGLSPALSGSCLIVLLTLLIIAGLRKAMWLDWGLVGLNLTGLLIIIFSGIGRVNSASSFDISMGWSSIFSAASLIFFAYLGFEHIANVSEEVKDPKRNLPLGFMISLGICTVLYVLVALVSTNAVPWQSLASSDAPLADVTFALLGQNWAIVLIIMALCATTSTVFASVVAGSRMLYGLAEEKSFPVFFGRLSKNGSPYVAVIVAGALALLFGLLGDISTLARYVNFGALFLFVVVNLSLIFIRFSHPHLQGGFRVPLNIGKFAVLPALAIAGCLWFMAQFDKRILTGFIIFLFAGMLLYVIFWERRHHEHISKEGEKYPGHHKIELKEESAPVKRKPARSKRGSKKR